LSLGSTLTQHMLVSVQGNDKVYDGNTTATLSFKGDPTVGGTKQVTLDAGAGATATFYDKNAASNIGITYSGYSLGGTDAGLFALPVFYCTTVPGRTSANITPAPLTLKASDATKVYGQTFAPLGTAFTVPVLPVAGETVTSVVETSTGSAPTASVAGSAYPIVITPGSATGTNFNQANYVITYQPGALTVTPLPVVVPPVETTPVETKPVATPPELPYEAPIVRPGVGAPTWMPVVVPPGTPPQLLTLAPPVPPIVVAPVLVVEQPPVIAPPESPPSIYVAPHRPRKQDRN
jgi:hypothetical protein